MNTLKYAQNALLYPIHLICYMFFMYYIMYRRYFGKLDGKLSKKVRFSLHRPCHGIFQNWAPRGHVENILYHSHFQQELSHGGYDSSYVDAWMCKICLAHFKQPIGYTSIYQCVSITTIRPV